jgi:hypothetical protein
MPNGALRMSAFIDGVYRRLDACLCGGHVHPGADSEALAAFFGQPEVWPVNRARAVFLTIT